MEHKGLRSRKIGAILAFSLYVALPAISVSALQVSDIEVRPALFWFGNGYTIDASGNPVQPSEVSPIVGGVGVGVGLQFSPLLSLRPALDIFGIQYALVSINGAPKAVPTQIETGSAVLMLNALLSVPLTFTWKLDPQLQFSAGVSPSMLFRIPTIGYGTPDRGGITSYLYADARFFYPEVQTSIMYRMSDQLNAGFTLRALFPIFHLWDAEAVPFWDQMIISGMLSLRFSL